MSAVRLSKCQNFTDEKLSTLLGLTRAVHVKAVAERQALSRAFEHLNSALLRHSVHRPPWSAAVFSLADMKAISRWFIQTYFAHYKLYQYTFTPRVLLDMSTHTAASLLEAPPQLPPLSDAITEEAHDTQEEEARTAEVTKAEADAAKVRPSACTVRNC